ncbi:MAG: MFS transporter [Oscillospiraceae bacterium]|nr:MFS transporter [Oscillospiraceae bacterium]
MNRRKIVVLIAGALIMLCAGILYMWSVFQPYVILQRGFDANRVSLTSAIMIACFVAGNIAAGLVQEKLQPRVIAIAGSVLFSAGLLLTGLTDSGSPGMLYFTYGVISGIGCGLVYSTVLAVLQKWYAAKTGFITGISVGFFGLSVVVLSPLVQMLLDGIGLTATFKTLALAFFVILVISSAFLRNPDKEYYYAEATKAVKLENVKQFLPGQMLKSASYYYIIISTFASSAAYLVIVPFITTIAVARGMSASFALFALMSTGIANSAGRILAPMLSDRLGRTRTIILCSVISAVGCILIISARGALYIAAVFLIAFSYGGAGGVNPVITTELFGARHSGANYGLVLLSIAASSVFFGKLSAPLSTGGDFGGIFLLCACLCAVPIVMMILLRKRCKRLGKTI